MTASAGTVMSGVARTLGAPGVFVEALPPRDTLTGVRRDIAAFAGVAPRGPSRVAARALAPDDDIAAYLTTGSRLRSTAVPVESWGEYQRLFGAYEGAGRLPYAVAAFFANGGRRAYIVRIVAPSADDAAGCAAGVLCTGRVDPAGVTRYTPVPSSSAPEIVFRSRNEGVWGDRLRVVLRCSVRPLPALSTSPAPMPTSCVVAASEWVPVGSLLRLRGASGGRVLRFVDDSALEVFADRVGHQRVVTFDAPAPEPPVEIEVVTGLLTVVDGDPLFARAEQITGIGWRSDHPRWLARAIIDESDLLWPANDWALGSVHLDPSLPDLVVAVPAADEHTPAIDHLAGASDLSAAITPDDFFDPRWVPGDEASGDGPSGEGIHCCAAIDEIGLLLAPDLYDPTPLPPVAERPPVTLAGDEFAPCVVEVGSPAPAPEPQPLAGLRLDPTVPGDLARIAELQGRLVTFAGQRGDLTALIDVPPGLPRSRILVWRAGFDSARAACYHPWLDVASPDDSRDWLVRVNPSAFAAGIIAAREWRNGVAAGPANVVAAGVVRTAVPVPMFEHDELHPNGINVFVTERDGVRLMGARTLSGLHSQRQLSVVRLTTVIALTLQREMVWAAFEPNNEQLWGRVRRLVNDYLDGLHRQGAFAGATPRDSFFVRCDRQSMTQADIDAGRCVVEVGFAPTEPTEFIVVRFVVNDDRGPRAEIGVSRG